MCACNCPECLAVALTCSVARTPEDNSLKSLPRFIGAFMILFLIVCVHDLTLFKPLTVQLHKLKILTLNGNSLKKLPKRWDADARPAQRFGSV